MNREIDEKLEEITHFIGEVDCVKNFRAVEKRINENAQIKEWTVELEQAQKDAVLYKRIDKKKAAEIADHTADQLNEKINNHPLVVSYRNQLKDVDDLLQYITQRIENEVNMEIEKRDNELGG